MPVRHVDRRRRLGCRALDCADKAEGWRHRGFDGGINAAVQADGLVVQERDFWPQG